MPDKLRMEAATGQSLVILGPSSEGIPALQQAGQVLKAFAAETGLASRHQRGHVLDVLARHAASPDSATQSLLPTAFLKQTVAASSSKEPSAWMSPLWQKLLDEEPGWQTGLQQTARELGLGYVPRLVKGGSSSALYGIEAVPVPADSEDSDETLTEIPTGGLRYTTERATEPAAWLRWLMRGGSVRWSLLPRLVVIGWFITGLLLLLAGLLVGYGTALTRRGPLTAADVWLLAMLAICGWIVWQQERFFSALFDLRIVMAPVFLTRIVDQGVTLELRRSKNEEEDTQLVLAKYTAACPLCAGTVQIFDGGVAFPDRLVGRCSRSSREHVYSLDPVLRIGAPLRG
jgi:hypothetical protein